MIQVHIGLLRKHLENLVRQRTKDLSVKEDHYRHLTHLSPVGILQTEPINEVSCLFDFSLYCFC
jgi:hypothetical protein